VVCIIGRKFVALIPPTSRGSAFGYFVRHVLGVRSKPQMRGVDTAGVIAIEAIVTHIQVFGDRATMQNPRRGVRCNHAAKRLAPPNLAIAAVNLARLPKPA
jgi:hypothetical protein